MTSSASSKDKSTAPQSSSGVNKALDCIFSQKVHRRLIGGVGLLLPFIVVFMSWLLPVKGPSGLILDSVSAYYYTSANMFFVGTLFSLAIFFFAYRGYEDDKVDRVMGKITGASALCVAFFPTVAKWFIRPSWSYEWMHYAHYISAVILFSCFMVFSIFLFTRTSESKEKQLKPEYKSKRWRNRIYLWCGIIMILSLVWTGVNSLLNKSVFWPEAIALCAFAVSWLVKGQPYKKPYQALWCRHLCEESEEAEK